MTKNTINNEPRTVVAYIRVSTEGQVEKYGLEAQRRDILTYCAKNNMYVSRWYVEKGVSGAKESRPELDRLVYGSDIENPPVEAVVVAKNDRVARDINIYYYMKMQLQKKGIELISVAEDFGEMGIMAKFLEAFTLCVAEMERDNITKRTYAGRKVKKSKGGYAGGRPAYGYKTVDRELVIDRREADCVKRIFLLRECGYALGEIADMVNEAGYRTRTGLEFNAGTVQNVLRHEAIYRGQLKYGGEYEGTYEKILA